MHHFFSNRENRYDSWSSTKGKQNQGKRESILAEYESQLEEGWVSILHFDINGCPRRKIQRGAD